MTESNPLFDSQREKAGPQTNDKYRYQYHWALYKVLSEYHSKKEYAVFVELHEDVVICDSLDATTANFEFNQVKTTSKNMSHKELVRMKKSIKGTSVLSKLVSGANGKAYASKLKQLNLVSVYPFTLKLKKEGVELQKITLDDLSDLQLQQLEEAIENELGAGNKLPEILQFIVSDLSEKNYQNDVIATISNLITKMYPGSYYNSVDIYRILIDEVNKKGVVTYDFAKWDELLNAKALTSKTINTVINQFTNIKDESKIDQEFQNIIAEIGLGVIAKKKLKIGFDRYRLSRIGNSNSLTFETSKAIQNKLNNLIGGGEENLEKLINTTIDVLEEKYKKPFSTNEELKGAIICEIIYMP